MCFQSVFDRLRALYAPVAPLGVVVVDTPAAFSIGTHEVRARDGYRTAFGRVEIHKTYVSAHLMPVYIHPELLQDISPALRRRMQGKSCFNFAVEDEILFEAFANLLAASVRRFQADGRLHTT